MLENFRDIFFTERHISKETNRSIKTKTRPVKWGVEFTNTLLWLTGDGNGLPLCVESIDDD